MSDHLIKTVEQGFLQELPAFRPGDTLRIHERIREGGKEGRERIQMFEGIVLKKSGSGSNAMFTVRKMSSGIGVEKVYPLHSPKIAEIEIVKQGHVRQARPNFLRKR